MLEKLASRLVSVDVSAMPQKRRRAKKKEERDDEQGGRILANQRYGNNSSIVLECPDAQDFWLGVLDCSPRDSCMEIFNTDSMLAVAPFVYHCSSRQMVQMMAESSTEFQIFHSNTTSRDISSRRILRGEKRGGVWLGCLRMLFQRSDFELCRQI